MSYQYIKDPQQIERESFRQIRELVDLAAFDREQQQVVMRVVHSLGLPHLAQQLRFTPGAVSAGIDALKSGAALLCDVEMVKQGLTKRMLEREPLCYLNHPEVPALAKSQGLTRTMAALDFWQPVLEGSVILIGNAPTALFRLLEQLGQTSVRPALIIAMPVGFVGAAESKQALWDDAQTLGVECITLLGREGGSAVTAASCNALLRCIRAEYY